MFYIDEERFKALIKEGIEEVLPKHLEKTNVNEPVEYPVGAEEASKYLNFKNKASFLTYVRREKVPHYCAGRKMLFYISQLKDYLEEKKCSL